MSVEAENHLEVIRLNMQILNGRFDALVLFLGIVLQALVQEDQREEIRKKLEMLVAPAPDLSDLHEEQAEKQAYDFAVEKNPFLFPLIGILRQNS